MTLTQLKSGVWTMAVLMGWGVRFFGGRTRGVILTYRGAGATRFRSLGPWFDGLDFGPGVGRPRQVRPLQGGWWLIACVSAVQLAQIRRVISVGGVPVSCSVPAVSVGGVVRPTPLRSDIEQRILSDLTSYQATAVQRLLSWQCTVARRAGDLRL